MLAPASFDAAQPTAFYLLGGLKRLESLSDATLVVADVELPVNSQVLSLQSKVLLDMFTTVGVSEESTSSNKEKAVLREPFVECELFGVALFLRFAYRPADLIPAKLAAVRGSLLGLLRLAHKLDAPQILQAVAQQMKDGADTAATQAELLSWAETAEQCCLPELRMRCLRELAHRLASGGDSLAAAFSSTAALADRCDHGTLATLLGLLAAGCGSTGAPRLLTGTSAAAVEALEASANHGSFEWAIDRYSQLPAGLGERTYSPYFEVAGSQWRMNICPGGQDMEASGHVSVYLSSKERGITANYSIALVKQGPGAQADLRLSGHAKFLDNAWGWAKFAAAATLLSHTYRRGDRLLLRATVEVTQRHVQPAAA